MHHAKLRKPKEYKDKIEDEAEFLIGSNKVEWFFSIIPIANTIISITPILKLFRKKKPSP